MNDIKKYTREYNEWETPATSYPEQELNNFRIHHGRYNRGTYYMYGIDGHIFFEALKPLVITNLQEKRGKKWHNWMVDDPPHWRAMEIYAEHSKGKVLTTGLGLGLYLQALAGNKKVERVVVVEKSIDVIRLIEPLLPALPNLEIFNEDFYDFIHWNNTQWDTIMVDLWVAHGVDEKMKLFNYEVIPLFVELTQRYPSAELTFHGFSSVSAIKHTSPEMTKLVSKIMGGK